MTTTKRKTRARPCPAGRYIKEIVKELSGDAEKRLKDWKMDPANDAELGISGEAKHAINALVDNEIEAITKIAVDLASNNEKCTVNAQIVATALKMHYTDPEIQRVVLLSASTALAHYEASLGKSSSSD